MVRKETVREALEEWVLDEKKIVTYKWLSRQLELQLDEAKESLKEFLESKRGKDGLNGIFYLSGLLKKEEWRVSLVREEELEKAKKHFQEVLSCHVYSIQCNRLKDLCAVYAVDLEDDLNCAKGDLKRGAIQCGEPDAVENDVEEIPPGPAKPEKPTRKSPRKQQQQHVEKKAEPKSAPGKKKEVPPKKGVQSKPPSGKPAGNLKQKSIGAMFSTMIQKAKEQPAAKKETKQKPASTPAAETPKIRQKSPQKRKTQSPPASQRIGRRVMIESDSDDENFVSTSIKITKTPKGNKAEEAKKNEDIFAADSSPEKTPTKSAEATLRRSPRGHKPSPKRSKVERKVETDGSSIDLFSGYSDVKTSDDDVIPPTPPPTKPYRKFITSTKKVAQSYQDQEGFLVTKQVAEKVTELVKEETPTTSDDNVVEGTPPKKPAPTKQSALTRFFKK